MARCVLVYAVKAFDFPRILAGRRQNAPIGALDFLKLTIACAKSAGIVCGAAQWSGREYGRRLYGAATYWRKIGAPADARRGRLWCDLYARKLALCVDKTATVYAFAVLSRRCRRNIPNGLISLARVSPFGVLSKSDFHIPPFGIIS